MCYLHVKFVNFILVEHQGYSKKAVVRDQPHVGDNKQHVLELAEYRKE